MLQLRPANERGIADRGWLNSRHTFSFGDYYDPSQIGFRTLRVINEDRVAPGQGFGRHPHRDMEIVSYVLSGALEHADSIGTGSVIRPGDVQRMSAGTGVTHSEYNHSKTEPVHFLQIWIEPERAGLRPSYEQKHFAAAEKRGRWRLIASADGRDNSVQIHQDVNLYSALIDGDEVVDYKSPADRHVWLHVARGTVIVNDKQLAAGDAVYGAEVKRLQVRSGVGAEVLLFDLA